MLHGGAISFGQIVWSIENLTSCLLCSNQKNGSNAQFNGDNQGKLIIYFIIKEVCQNSSGRGFKNPHYNPNFAWG